MSHFLRERSDADRYLGLQCGTRRPSTDELAELRSRCISAERRVAELEKQIASARIATGVT